MITPKHKLGRRTISFTLHALERYFERTGLHVIDELRRDLETARWSRALPGWAELSTWHRAIAEGAVMLAPDRAFIVNRNPEGELVAVTYVDQRPPPA